MSAKFHVKCRPPRGACGVDDGGDENGDLHPKPLALSHTGRWKRDDGKPAVAFLGSLDGTNIVWVASCKCRDASCPRWKALEHAREELGIESIMVHERPQARAR